MTELEDFDLGGPPEEPPPPSGKERPSAVRVAGLGILVLVVAGGLGLLLSRACGRTPSPAPTPAATVATPAPSPLPTASPAVTPPIQLPALDQSDALVRRLAAGLSARPELAAWLATDGLIRRFVAAVDNVADGALPTKQLDFLRPRERFSVSGERDRRVVIDPRSYHRYDAVAAVFASVDAAGAVRLYRSLKLLVDAAYKDLGYPDRDFDDTLGRAIAMLLEAPVLEGPVELTHRVISYRFADPKLEALPDARKALMRMGPRNERLIQAKLRELAGALGRPHVGSAGPAPAPGREEP